MTKLEETIEQIISERLRKSNNESNQKNAEMMIDQKAEKYNKEFDAIYRKIRSIGQIEREFIEWSDKCKIDDSTGEIVDGTGFYQHLLQEAHSAYQRFREEGYECQTAFDKGTQSLTCWIQDSVNEKPGGTIYLNYPTEFLCRMRKLADDW